MFLDNKNKVLKPNVDGKYDYIIYIASKEECDAHDKNVLKSPYEIIAHGATKEMDETLATNLLPEPRFIHNLLTSSLRNSYKCWACERLGIDQHVAHISAMDSWQCLIDTMGHPDYVIIIQKPIENAETEVI